MYGHGKEIGAEQFFGLVFVYFLTLWIIDINNSYHV